MFSVQVQYGPLEELKVAVRIRDTLWRVGVKHSPDDCAVTFKGIARRIHPAKLKGIARVISGAGDFTVTTRSTGEESATTLVNLTYEADNHSPKSASSIQSAHEQYAIDFETAIDTVRPTVFNKHTLWRELGCRNRGVMSRRNY